MLIKKSVVFFMFLINASFALTFSIDKPSFHVVTDPGSSQSFSLSLKNSGDQPLKVKVYTQDWIYAQNKKGKVFLAPGTEKNSCAKWIKLEQQEFVLEPKTKKDYSFRIETPHQAEGGQQAVLFFETQLDTKNKGLSYGARIGTIIYQETKSRTLAKLEYVQKKAGERGGKVFYQLTVRNAGNAWNSATAIVSLLRNGEVVEQQNKPVVNLLPGDSVELSDEFSKSGDEVLVTIEDSKENLFTERLTLNGETVNVLKNSAAEVPQNGR